MQVSAVDVEFPDESFVGYSRWLQVHPVLASVIILCCALFLRMLFVYSAAPSQLLFPDSGTYLDPALSLRESGSFLNKYQTPEVTRTPGYPLFLAAIMTCVGTDIRTLLIVQAAIVSAGVVILYCLARHILPPVMAFTSGLLAAFSPWTSARAGFLLSDGLFLLLLSILFIVMYLVVRYVRNLTPLIVAGSIVGFLTAAVVFVRPVFPLIVLVAAVMFLLHPGKRIRVWLLVGSMMVSALAPLHLWEIRNLHQAKYSGFSDIAGKAAWQWLASSVKGQLSDSGGDRWAILRKAEEEETHWRLSLQQADEERWRLAKEVFRAHPFLTAYVFILNAGEALVHPQSNILTPAGLNFYGDAIVLGGMWAFLVLCAALGMGHVWRKGQDIEFVNRNWLVAMLIICSVLTITGGVSFGAGARYRSPLELIVPLLAGVGLVRIVTGVKRRAIKNHI